MAFINKPLEWNAFGEEPSQEKKNQGFGEGEYPAAGHFDRMFNATYKVITEIIQNAVHKDTLGKPNGVATLNENGKVPADQLDVKPPPDASTTTKGIVKLNSATNSTDETTAATPNAVKSAYDLANGKYAKPASGIPKTDLASSVQSSLLKADQAETPAGAQAKVDQAIANLINGAPGALDTLIELANAMGNDPNFAATITNQLSQKLDKTTLATLASAGIVRLSSSTTSIDETMAATPKAVKETMDKAKEIETSKNDLEIMYWMGAI